MTSIHWPSPCMRAQQQPAHSATDREDPWLRACRAGKRVDAKHSVGHTPLPCCFWLSNAPNCSDFGMSGLVGLLRVRRSRWWKKSLPNLSSVARYNPISWPPSQLGFQTVTYHRRQPEPGATFAYAGHHACCTPSRHVTQQGRRRDSFTLLRGACTHRGGPAEHPTH